jgi:hypothetical protein
MRRRHRRPEPAPPQQELTRPTKPPWQEFLDPRSGRADRTWPQGHDVFADSIREPVPLPRWLRGPRRPPRDKLS